MSTPWFCLDCGATGELSRQGRCATCNSDGVAIGYHKQSWLSPTVKAAIEILAQEPPHEHEGKVYHCDECDKAFCEGCDDDESTFEDGYVFCSFECRDESNASAERQSWHEEMETRALYR